MSCAHGYIPADAATNEGIFSVDASNLTFGRGALREIGPLAASLSLKRVAVFTDPRVRALESFHAAINSLRGESVDHEIFDQVHVEPTDASFKTAIAFATAGRFDGYVSIGGGSVIDTCKAANLYATYPAELLTYVNKPVGAGALVRGALPPHIACPTTSGTGSELTGIAVFDLLDRGFKTGIASRRLRPSFAIVDPDVTRSLPASVVAASGFDVLCHALESFTARPFTARPRSASPADRPMSQGRNPWSDLGSLEALRIGARYLERAVRDASDDEAREAMMWAATLAGLAFGNAGVHLPHAMAYAVAGIAFQESHAPSTSCKAARFAMKGYGDVPLVPHGVSVVASAPAAFRFTAEACPDRHLEGARALGSQEAMEALPSDDVGKLVAATLERLMRATHVPIDLSAVGYRSTDIARLTNGTLPQRRLLDNAPRKIDKDELDKVFADALRSPAATT